MKNNAIFFNQRLHERLLFLLFQLEFRSDKIEELTAIYKDYPDDEKVDEEGLGLLSNNIAVEISDRIVDIDNLIQQFLENWSFERIMLVDKETLRIGVYELLYQQDMEPRIVIDRLVRLSKKYGGENSGKFINGILGAIHRNNDSLFNDR